MRARATNLGFSRTARRNWWALWEQRRRRKRLGGVSAADGPRSFDLPLAFWTFDDGLLDSVDDRALSLYGDGSSYSDPSVFLVAGRGAGAGLSCPFAGQDWTAVSDVLGAVAGSFTFNFWLKPMPVFFGPLFFQGHCSGVFREQFNGGLAQDGSFMVWGDWAGNFFTGPVWEVGVWHMVTLIVINGVFDFWIDGAFAGRTERQAVNSAGVWAGVDGFALGGFFWDWDGNPGAGWYPPYCVFDDVGFWPSVLSGEDVAWLWNGGVDRSVSEMLA